MKKILLIFFFLPNFLFSQGYCVSDFTLSTFDDFEINFMRGKTTYRIILNNQSNLIKATLFRTGKLKNTSFKSSLQNDTLKLGGLNYSITFFPNLRIYSTSFKNNPILCKVISHNLDDLISLPSNFKSCIENEVVARMNLWKIKGEFEKTVDFTERTNSNNVNLTEIKFRNEVEQEFINQSVNKFNVNNLSLGKYDADNECFKIYVSGLNSFNLSVPIGNAPMFKENFNVKNFFDLDLSFVDYVFEISKISYKTKNKLYLFNLYSSNLDEDDSYDSKLILEDVCVSGDCLNGNGSFMWASGSSYSGNWIDGEMSGFGTYVWSTGRKYVGEWLIGKMNGEGVLTEENGKVVKGDWLDGEFVEN
tara:strand:- start:739 stop:1824 length:1086 start_codon:yes stop_codon:yes gene_type:complete